MSESQKRQERDAEESGGRSASKRLKSSEPDLSIVCRFDGKEETIQIHSVIMANHSNYFDTLLASGMQESETKTVTLDDVDPKSFRSAIEILEDPQNILTVSAEEMLKAAPIYNRFEFSKGLKLAETVLGTFLEDWTKQNDKTPVPEELKLIGDSILLSHEAKLDTLTQQSISFIKTKLDRKNIQGYGIFQQSFFEKFSPFLLENKEACFSEFIGADLLGGATRVDSVETTLASPNLLQYLYCDILRKFSFFQIDPLKLDFLASVCLPGSGHTLPSSIRSRPYRKVPQRLGGSGAEIICGIDRLDLLGLKHAEKGTGTDGDWCVEIRVVGGKKYCFVWPFSREFPLPPIGNHWIWWPDDDVPDGQEPTLEILGLENRS